MPSKVLMDVEEYLHASFDGPDCEYLDGEVVERNMGWLPHGILQGRLIFLLMQAAERLQIRVVPEIRFRSIPAVFVWRTWLPGVPATSETGFPPSLRSW